MDDDSILNLDAFSLSQKLANGQLSAVELMTATLERIDSLNPTFRAIILLRDHDELIQEACQADRLMSSRKGWLHGVPMAIKDLANVAGIPTTMGGSPFYESFVPGESDLFVQRLQDSGAIIIGKTNTPELGLGSHTFNKRFGTTANSYNRSLSAGGSSGGAAVAVATRMLALADGTDMMGSLRNPAGWNGLYSIRPTAGLLVDKTTTVPSRNPLDYPISTVGPIARNVRDLALLLETMVGKDKWQAPSELVELPLSSTSQSSTGNLVDLAQRIKIAWLGDWGGSYPMEDGILETCRSSLSARLPHAEITDLADTGLFPPDKLWTSWTTIRSAVIADQVKSMLNGDVTKLFADEGLPIRSELKWEALQGLAVNEEDLREARSIADEWSNTLENVFQKFDVLALPSSQVWPFPGHWDWPKVINGKPMETYHQWMQIMIPVSLAGLPAMTVPARLGNNGLPIGIQLVGRRFSDGDLLRLAHSFHEAANHNC